MTRRRAKPCSIPQFPHALTRARLYPCGWCCARHTPAAQAGRPEPQPGPGYTPQGILSPLGDSRVHDARAVASGKRRSSPHEYRAAQAGVAKPPPGPDLRVDLGQWDDRAKRWMRYPTADFRCPCGFTDSASGDAVARFAAHIEEVHRPHCPNARET